MLHCKKSLFNQSAARAILLYPLFFSAVWEQKDLAEKNKQSENK